MKEIWIGHFKDCRRCAGTERIHHVIGANKLRGLRGPIKAYHCGDYWNCANADEIKQALRELENTEEIERIYRD